VLSAIKIASFGHNMEINTTCPKCGEMSTYNVDLRTILDNIVSPNYDNSFSINDLKIFFKPLTYKDINDNSKINFEEEQLYKIIDNNDMPEEDKLSKLSIAFKKVSSFTIATIVKNINKIETPEVTVNDPKYILDFLKHCERHVYDKIKENIILKRSSTDIKPLHIICDNVACKYEFDQPFTMDMSTFFE